MKPFWTSLVVVCAVAGGGYYWWKSSSAKTDASQVASADAKKGKGKGKGDGKGRRGGGPVNVSVISPSRQPMPVIIDAVGTVESEHSVQIRPQASGVLEAVLFKEGDRIRPGQVLFRIDSRPMRTAVEQASAALARDEAQLAQAKAQEARLRPLMEKDYITRNEYDVAATLVKSLEATTAAGRAAVEQAKLNLSYAQIQAPIGGVTGSLNVKAGNLVTAGTVGNPLVVVNSTQPISVALAVPQRHLEELRKYWGTPDLKVQISPDKGAVPVAEGKLVFMDNSVNVQTGTILLKASVRNEREQLWPGQFVSARIVLRVDQDAVVLPESAVQPGQDRPFVYVVRDGKAIVQEVDIARQVNELVVIAKGLKGDEQVIGDVPTSLTPGGAVIVRAPGEGKGGKGAKGEKGEGKGAEKAGDKDGATGGAKEASAKGGKS